MAITGTFFSGNAMCNIIDYREGREGSELGRNGGRKREGGRKPSETVASLQLPMIY